MRMHIFLISERYSCQRLRLFSMVMIIAGFTAMAVQAFGSYPSILEDRLDYQAVSQPFGNLVEEIEDKIGATIVVDEEWLAFPVSINLRNSTVKKALQRALRQLGVNYSLVLSGLDTIDIKILGRPRSESGITQSLSVASSSITDKEQNQTLSQKPSTDPLDYPAVPPEPDKPTLTGRQVQEELNKGTRPDPLEYPAVPPEEGKPTVTARELKEELKRSDRPNPLDYPAVPPNETSVD